MTSSDEAFQLCFQDGLLLLPDLDVDQLGGEQRADVGTGTGSFAAQLQDGGDLDQAEPRALPAA